MTPSHFGGGICITTHGTIECKIPGSFFDLSHGFHILVIAGDQVRSGVG